MNDIGGISVVGLKSGGHLIEDIRINVPHKGAVYIPIELYLKSKDLHRAINSGVIFKLDSVTGSQQEVVAAVDSAKIVQLELENARLKEALEIANKQKADLQSSLDALKGQTEAILSALGRIEAAPRVVNHVTTTAALPGPTSVSNEAVGGDAPMFLPDLSQDLGDARINIESSVSKNSVAGAAEKLRELRKAKK